MKLHYFDAGGSTVGHGEERKALCLSGSVGLFTDDGARIARSSYGEGCLRELRPDEVSNLLSALGVKDAAALPRLQATQVRDAVQGLLQAFGTANGLAPLPVAEANVSAAKARARVARPAGGDNGNP